MLQTIQAYGRVIIARTNDDESHNNVQQDPIEHEDIRYISYGDVNVQTYG